MAKLEFYIGHEPKHIAVVNGSAVPREGEFINIRKVTYKIIRVTWAVDNADDIFDAQLRANIEMEPA